MPTHREIIQRTEMLTRLHDPRNQSLLIYPFAVVLVLGARLLHRKSNIRFLIIKEP